MTSSNIDPGDAAYRAWQLTKDGERMRQYGHPWNDYTMVRRLFATLTNYKHNLTVQEAALFMVCVKMARLMKSLDAEKLHEDSLVDAIGLSELPAHDRRARHVARRTKTHCRRYGNRLGIMTSPQKRKGHAAELAVVKWLREKGIMADRIQAGTHADKGDVTGWPGIVIEVKDGKAHSWHGYFERLREQITNANAYTGVIICKRPGLTDVGEWMAVMPVTEWFNLLQILEDTKQ